MRKIIAAFQLSLDGFIEGPNGELDWIESWEDDFGLMDEVDTCVLGGGMYPGYEAYWSAILADPQQPLALSGKTPTEGEIAYAAFAHRTPHLVLSRTLDTVSWKNTRIVRDLDEIAALKQQPGKAIHAVGGASLFTSLLERDLVDELRLVVHPVLLGAGKALFGGNIERKRLLQRAAGRLPSGSVRLNYAVSRA